MNTSRTVRLAVSRQFAIAAFTLLELLVVISIIAVLAGILLPVTGSVMETAKKTSAKNTIQQVVTAVKSYQTDYGIYPVVPNAPVANPPVDTTFDGTTNQNLFAILRATDAVATSPNTRRSIYFEGKDVKNIKAPKDGFLPLTAAAVTQASGTGSVNPGALVDPWGNGYYIRYDSGYTDAVKHPYVDGSNTADDPTGTTTGILRFGVVAWSYGKDSSVGKGVKQGLNGVVGAEASGWTYGDDVVSWQ